MGLIRIGELLHCHIPSVQKSARRWLCGDALDRIAGERHLVQLVKDQAEAGADYLDVNVDDFLTDPAAGREGALRVLGHILELIGCHGKGIPACIDSSDPGVLEVGLRRYYELRGPNAPSPLVNSVAVSRLETLSLRKQHRFSVIGMLLEKVGATSAFTEVAGPEAYHETARFLFDRAREAGFAPEEIFFDPTVGPLGADMVGYTRRTFEGIRSIRSDPDIAGAHVCIGLSNCSDGLPRRTAINRAYLRVAMEYGLDAAILDVTQVTGQDPVDPRILNLVRQIAEPESADALSLLVDYVQAHPRRRAPKPRLPLPDPFREALQDPARRAYILEMAPSEGNVDQIYAMAEAARETPFTFSITDTPGGNRAPGPDVIGVEVGRIMGRQPIVNLSCKSDDRDGLIRRVLGLHSQGLRNFFAVTGDYPARGRASFDLDSVTLLMAMTALRRGLEFPGLLPRPGKALEGLIAGAAVSPFKYREADLWGQYHKMWKKRRAGADYFITQVGYDVRKFHELRLFMNRAGLGDAPVIASVFLLTPQVALAFERIHVAGVVIPEDLRDKYRGKLASRKERGRLKKMSFSELADHQRRLSLRRAALLTDILTRGLGYRGVDLAGVAKLEDALEILEMIRELEACDWRESYAEYREGDGEREIRFAPDRTFYLFPDGEDGLLKDGPVQTADRGRYPETSRMMAWLHRTFFEPGTAGHDLLSRVAGGPENGGLARLTAFLERTIKAEALGCEMCGDCRIADLSYLCPEPERGCAKRLLNGPCGGADVRGMCEVHPERRCYWGEVIERTLRTDGLDGLSAFQPPKDPRLVRTSSWRNEALGLCPEALDLGKFELRRR